MKLSKIQKNIILIEIIFIVIGTLIFVAYPTKKVDLSSLWTEFQSHMDEFYRYTGMSASIMTKNTRPILILNDTIVEIFNERGSSYNEIFLLVEEFKRELRNLSSILEIYESLQRDFQTARSTLNVFVRENTTAISSDRELDSKVKASQEVLKTLGTIYETATTLEELRFIQDRLQQEIANINFLPTLARESTDRAAQKKRLEEEGKRQELLRRQQETARREAERKETERLKAEEEAKKKEEVEREKTPVGRTSPVRLISRAIPDYPERIKDMGFGGRVSVRVAVGADGKPKDTRIVRSSNNEILDENARRAARNCTFEAEYQNGVAVVGDIIIEYEFDPTR